MIRKAYIDLAAGQLHYRHVAGTGTPIVFLHQTASSGRMWERVMTRLAGGHPLFALDTPGFGGSFDPAIAPEIADYASWIAEALAALGIARAHIVGHHTGAAIGLQLAVTGSSHVATLTMIGVSPLTAEERAAFAAKLGAAFKPSRSGAYLLQNWEYLRVGGAAADMALLHDEMVGMLRAWSARPYAYAAVWRQDGLALLPRVACPLLLMTPPDDILFPYLARALSLRPDADTVALSGGANFAPDLVPDEIAAAVRGFVDRAQS